jgi:hypothetical protein
MAVARRLVTADLLREFALDEMEKPMRSNPTRLAAAGLAAMLAR